MEVYAEAAEALEVVIPSDQEKGKPAAVHVFAVDRYHNLAQSFGCLLDHSKSRMNMIIKAAITPKIIRMIFINFFMISSLNHSCTKGSQNILAEDGTGEFRYGICRRFYVLWTAENMLAAGDDLKAHIRSGSFVGFGKAIA